MAYLDFDVTGATLHYGTGGISGSPEPLIKFILKYKSSILEKLDLSTGESKDDLDFSLQFHSSAQGLPPMLEGAEGVGVANYFPYWSNWSGPDHRATLSFSVYISENAYREMISFARSGRYPESVSIEIPDIESTDYFGSDRTLNTTTKTHFVINDVGYSFQISPHASEEGEVEKARPARSVPDPSRELLDALATISQWQRWIFGVLVILVVVVLLRH